MRKILTFLFAALMSASMFASDTQVDGIYYDFNSSTQTASVMYKGATYSSYSDEYSGSVSIPSSVTYSGVTYSVTSIGAEAFRGCSGLTSVTINAESLESYGSGAFDDTHANLKIYVPAGSVATYKAAWAAYADKIKAIPPAWLRDGDDWDDATKTLTVNSNLPENAYRAQTVIEHVIISSGVTSIGWTAFYNCTGLTSVTIPEGVTSIELQAFAHCTALTSIEIPSSVTIIGSQAFGDCTSLTSVTILAESLEWYGLLAFQVTPATLKIYVPAGSVNTYKAEWYIYADKITAIVVNPVQIDGLYYNLDADNQTAEVTSMPSGKYTGDIIIPESVEYYSVTYTVTSIGDYAFSGCSGLTSITIPNSVTSIGQSAFASCSGLTSVRCVRETPANLGNDAFNECSNLNAIYVPCGTLDAYQSSWTQYQSYIQYAQPEYTIIGNVNIAGAGTVILPQTICDNSITASPNYGYHFVQWSDGVTENPRTIELTQDTTFTAEFAKNEYTITTESANSEWGTAEGGTSALYLDNIQISATPNYGYHFVQWNDNNTSNPRIIQVTENKTYTATFAKNTYSITKNAVNGSIAGLSQAEYLDEVTLTATHNYGYHFVQWSDGVTENPRAFVLTQDTTFTAEFAYDRTGTCGNDWALTWTYDPEGKVLTISGNGAFEQNMQCGAEARGEMTEVIFEDGVTSIGNFAFQDCTSLTSVTIGNSVTSIGGSAFHSCSHLTSVTIPNSVTSIGHAAFIACEGLTSVTIGNSVTSIGDNAFQYCYGLTSITIPNSVTSIGEQAFAMCSSLASITIPSSVEYIGEGAFAMCSGLTSVTCVRETPANLGNGAFDDTHANLKIYVPAGSVKTYKAGWAAYADKIVAIHSITINESSHGSVVASSSSAAAGETITLTATPDDGYRLKSISGVYLPVPETLNSVSAQTTVTGTNFQCVGTMNANLYGWRVYNSETLTVSSLNGTTLIKKIEFTSEWGEQRENNMLSVSAGTLSFDGNDPSTTVTINGINATSVTIHGSGTNNAKTWCINSVKVYTEEELEISDTENANVKTFTMVDGEVTISAEFEPVPTPEPEDVNITPNVDPQHAGVYYSTFYDSANKYALPAGVEAYVATIGENVLNLTRIAVAGQVIPNGEAVILKSTVTPFTLTPSEADAVTFSATNSLQGTDVAIATPANCYVLGGADGVVGFYRYNGTNLNPHKAYVVFSGSNQAPRRMPFIFEQENTATGVENVQGNVQSTKVIENGVLYIIKNGVRYNAQGQVVK